MYLPPVFTNIDLYAVSLPVDWQRSAALVAADNSTCVDDCIELLEILGINLEEVWPPS
jgi:hypothetical protein